MGKKIWDGEFSSSFHWHSDMDSLYKFVKKSGMCLKFKKTRNACFLGYEREIRPLSLTATGTNDKHCVIVQESEMNRRSFFH